MNALRRWWRDWALVDSLTLGGGLLLAVTYIRNHAGSWDEPVRKLWPDVALALLGTWLSVRLIGGLLERRQTRSSVRGAVVGNLNYMMGIAQRLGPRFYDFDRQALQNELTWFNEKRRLRGTRLRRAFSVAERQTLEEVVASLEALEKVSTDGQRAFSKLEQISNTVAAYSAQSPLRDLHRSLDAYDSSAPQSTEDLAKAISAAEKTLASPAQGKPLSPELEYVALAKLYFAANSEVRALVAAVEDNVANLRRKAWAED